ncbi:MAG: WD40 repeat domain-containing protein [Acidobacteria bacterium]|nr:WD40 repeat domain-containing protein [Acidobacteriota bacterium]
MASPGWIVAVGLALVMSSGAAPTFWQVSTQAEFLRGEVDAVSVDADGRLSLGPATDTFFDTSAPVLWSLARATDDALWVGSGNDGRVYRVEPSGRGELVFDADAPDVYALAPAPNGDIFAATSPDGVVYRITADGGATPVFEPDETYVWALALAPDGALLVATGAPARIYRVTPGTTESTLVYESDATHVLSLAVEPSGAILAGTESPGQVLRIDPAGRAFVLLDSPHDEIRSLRMQPDGGILVVAVTGGAMPAASSSAPSVGTTTTSTPTASVSVTTTVSAVVATTSGSPPTSSASPTSSAGGTGAVYRIAPDGLWDELWSSSTETPYDAVFDGDGGLTVGTGPDGRLYRVTTEPPSTVLLGRAPAKQITRFLRYDDGAIRYATANPGKVVRLTAAVAERGTYLSEVRDAETVATWGTLSWRGATPGGSRIEISTRSGNTEVPNATWSEWSAPSEDPTGTAIASPNARYLQWRAALIAGDAAPSLTSVSAAYLPRNLRPVVTSLTVYPPGSVFQQPFASGDPPVAGLQVDETRTAADAAQGLGRQGYRKGIQTFVWQASDGNADTLEYALSYRREGESAWHLLQSGMDATVFAWNTALAPDGAYRVKVSASDASANAPALTLVGERESQVFEIDNTAPRIELGPPRGPDGAQRLSFTVRDDQSSIHRVETWDGGGAWRVVYPNDGIPDGRVEVFDVPLAAISDDAGVLLIRAIDALANSVTVSVP